MSHFAEVVVAGFSVLFIGIGSVMFVRPVLFERFICSFASSARAHYTEMSFRLLLGVSMVLLSQAMRQAGLFLVIGWTIVASTVVLLILPWQWHHRLRPRVLPVLLRYMRLYALGAFLFGVFLLYGIQVASVT
jgi:hypothetical protein